MGKIALRLLQEMGKGFIGRIAWKYVVERMMTRTAVHLLQKLADKSSNTLVDETVEDLINLLEGSGLPAATEYRRH
jgi:hypothetical protein